MEMLFRKIEYLIDGSAAQQLRRDKAALTLDTVRGGAALKHAMFFALSFVIANVFLAYIIGADALWAIVTAPPREHLTGLAAITIFSLRVLRRLRALPRAGVHARVPVRPADVRAHRTPTR